MKAIFDEYGVIVLVVIVCVALIGAIGLMYNDENTGWVQNAFKQNGLIGDTSSDVAEDAHETLAMKTYTLEEINESVYLNAIGVTNAEYVVASFNADYTKVTIFKNGNSSDALCANYSLSSPSVFTKGYSEKLTNVVFESGMTRVSDNMFLNCTALHSVTIPESVVAISSSAFEGCSSLTTIYGVSGSYAETYANNNGYTFIEL